MVETHLKSHHSAEIIHVDGYETMRKDRTGRRGGGVAIFLRKGITYTLDINANKTNNKFEILWTELMYENRTYIIGALYHPPNPNYNDRELLQHLENVITALNNNYPSNTAIILAGDFNGLSNIAITEQTGMHEIVQKPTRGSNCLDRIYVNNIKYLYINVIDSTINSDHKAILATNLKPSIPKTKTKHLIQLRTPNKIGEYKEYMSTYTFEVRHRSSAQELFNEFYTKMHNVVDTFFPYKEVTLTNKEPPFVTPLIKYLLRRKNKLMRKGRKTEAQIITDRIKRQIMYDSAHRFKDLSLSNPKKLWKVVKEIVQPGTSKENNDTVTAEQLNDHYCSISTDPGYEAPLIKATVNPNFAEYVNAEDIYRPLSRLKKTTAGTDSLSYWFLKHSANFICEHLAYIINVSINSNMVPTQWKQAQITPVAKIKKPSEPKDYRPISITPILTRLTEKIIIKKFLSNIIRRNPKDFYDQFGFRETGSTTSAIITLLNEISVMLTKSSYVRIISLDFTKAFDTVRHSQLFNKLANYNLDDNIYNWLIHYFEKHLQRTTFNNDTTVYKAINAGVIQGSTIGPFAFTIISSDLHTINPNNKLVKYADDTYLIISANNIHMTSQELDNISQWANTNNLKLNRSKSKEMLIGSPNIIHNIQDQIKDIPRVESMNVLGVTLNCSLKSNLHINRTMDNLGHKFYFLKMLKSKGLPGTELDVVFRALILSRITYAIQSWWGFAQASEKQRINALLKRSFRWGYTKEKLDIESIASNLNQRLFKNIEKNQHHVLFRLLPEKLDHRHNTRRANAYRMPRMTPTLKNNFVFNYLIKQHDLIL